MQMGGLPGSATPATGSPALWRACLQTLFARGQPEKREQARSLPLQWRAGRIGAATPADGHEKGASTQTRRPWFYTCEPVTRTGRYSIPTTPVQALFGTPPVCHRVVS